MGDGFGITVQSCTIAQFSAAPGRILTTATRFNKISMCTGLSRHVRAKLELEAKYEERCFVLSIIARG